MNGSTDALICSATATFPDIARQYRNRWASACISSAAADMTGQIAVADCTTSRSSHARCSARPCGRRTNPLDGGDGALADAADRRNAGTTRYAVDNHRARRAQCNPAANLVPVIPRTSRNTHSNGVSPRLDIVARPVDSDSEGHHYSNAIFDSAARAQLCEPAAPVFAPNS